MPILTHAQARACYDRIGAWQDTQRFYEGPAVREVVRYGGFESAGSVLELGCGTGRLAETLLDRRLEREARYVGLDVSPTMVGLTRARLARFEDRARVLLTDGSPELPFEAGSFDRYLSTYVLDLLSPSDIRTVLAEAHRVLVEGGRLALVSLTHGATRPARAIETIWTRIHAWRPALVGGCRPLDLRALVSGQGWTVQHRAVVTAFGISSEVLVAMRVAGTAAGPTRGSQGSGAGDG
ncbi:MAG: class I SAM-dependent methyltransferase [Candidatus Palauibacterales bacterium]|nr:class I SAM-dependent methyltransferase [Candidatus Palauibacterales bacterium]MDP2530666.1 class I SAM-dependent methyltransferase [Candidatus Palauibacterales bacterium]MDP2583379.1 class I SAM-dependent methyltransferase [Candidatus Palauibacterales bacterium]